MRNRGAIKLIETRIAELSKEDPTNNERVIREFKNLRQSILKQEEEDVDMDDDEEEDSLDELEKKFEKRMVVGVIIALLTYQEHESAFTPDMVDNPPDGDPMLLLTFGSLLRISVRRLRTGFNGLLTPMVKESHDNRARARALLPSNNNNNADTTDSDDESEHYKEELFSESDCNSDSNSEEEEEEEKKSALYWKGIGKKDSLTTKVGNLINSSDGKRLKIFDEEQQEKRSRRRRRFSEESNEMLKEASTLCKEEGLVVLLAKLL